MSDIRAGTKPRTSVRVTRLDGLRGLAVISVVVFHAEANLGLFGRPGGGFVGVAVFFVLSGYLITHLVWVSRDGTSLASYRAFLRRRFTRLAPAMTAFILVWAVISAVFGREEIGSVLRSAALAGTQTSAYYLGFGGRDHAGWGPTWSLSVEWCFYLLWPLLIMLLRRRGVTALAASRVAVALGVILYAAALPLTDTQFYYLPLANVSVLLWGGALALRHIRSSAATEGFSTGRDPAVVLLGIALLVALAAAPGDQGAGYRWLFLPAAVVGALIVVDGRPGERSVSTRFLESKPLRGLGLRAYSIYLWHVPVMWFVYRAMPGRSVYLVAGLSMLVLAPVVVASFELFERPWLSGRAATRARLPQTRLAAQTSGDSTPEAH